MTTTTETLDRLVAAMTDRERETYVEWLRDVVGGPSVGGYGQYLGSIAPLALATIDQRAEALRRMLAAG